MQIPSTTIYSYPELNNIQNTLNTQRINADKSNSQIESAAKELESIFINTLVEEMFSSLSTEKPFGGGFAEETYRGLLTNEYSKSIAQSGGVGLADHIMRDLLKLQETA